MGSPTHAWGLKPSKSRDNREPELNLELLRSEKSGSRGGDSRGAGREASEGRELGVSGAPGMSGECPRKKEQWSLLRQHSEENRH